MGVDKVDNKSVGTSNGAFLVDPLRSDLQDKKSIIGFEFTKEDHEIEMDEKKKLHDYETIYEEAIIKRENQYVIPKRIQDFTADKRRFGLKKYGNYSFQISFENSVTCDINEHIKSEITDLINYINHRDLMRDFKGLECLDSREVIIMLVNLFEGADELSKEVIKHESKK